LIVYFAPNNSKGKYDALSAAISSSFNPSVISCSWGGVEENMPSDFVLSFEQLLQDAALRGVTVCFSSGDKGSDPDSHGKPRAHYPASSPYVLACGGTHWIVPSDPLKEVVWEESFPNVTLRSGGGVSKKFRRRMWQKSARVKRKTGKGGRGLPDVSGKADITRGYHMIVAGHDATMGGTSAASPLWAGLIARLNQSLGYRIGYLTPLLYQRIYKHCLRDITLGGNGDYHACKGWDPCTGLGTPIGKKLLDVLTK
jgi:kumamolisin